jgi:serine/threonine protein kinase
MFAGDMTPDSLDMDKDDEFGSSTGPRPIPYADLAAATSNFSEDGKLGQGGSGSVYRGHMKQLGGRDVAIKVFLRGASTEGRKEYRSEVTIISRLRHRNLVQLIGWCHGRRRLLLVYELVHNGSLDGYLYSKQETALTWQVRYAFLDYQSISVVFLT